MASEIALDGAARAALDYMRAKPFPTDHHFTITELVAQLTEYRQQDLVVGIAQLQAAGLILKGPKADGVEDWWRPDNRIKV